MHATMIVHADAREQGGNKVEQVYLATLSRYTPIVTYRRDKRDRLVTRETGLGVREAQGNTYHTQCHVLRQDVAYGMSCVLQHLPLHLHLPYAIPTTLTIYYLYLHYSILD